MHLAMEGAIIDGSASVGVGLLLAAGGLAAGYVGKWLQGRITANGAAVRESADIAKMREEIDELLSWKAEVKKAKVDGLEAKIVELQTKLDDSSAGSGVRKTTQPHPRGSR